MARRVLLTSSGPVLLEETRFQTRRGLAETICAALAPRPQFIPLQGMNYIEDGLISALDAKRRAERRSLKALSR